MDLGERETGCGNLGGEEGGETELGISWMEREYININFFLIRKREMFFVT